MERHAFAMKLKEGKKNQFKANLGKVWPGLTALLDAHDASNFSMWNVLDMVFGYFETPGELVYTDEIRKRLPSGKKHSVNATTGSPCPSRKCAWFMRNSAWSESARS